MDRGVTMDGTGVRRAAKAVCLAGATWLAVAAISLAGPRPGVATEGWPTLSGTVSVKERITLPAMATVRLELIDASARDPRAATVAEQTIWPAGAPFPFTFRIGYDPSRIDPTHSYVLRVRVLDGEKVLYADAMAHYVLTRGAPDVIDVVIVPIRVR